MKRNNSLTFLLLFIMSLYVTHGLFFIEHHEHEHDAIEYISELQAPVEHGDICDFHFVFHQVFLIPTSLTLYHDTQANVTPTQTQKTYLYAPLLEFYKPPIFS